MDNKNTGIKGDTGDIETDRPRWLSQIQNLNSEVRNW
jgi:hypothetical protein